MVSQLVSVLTWGGDSDSAWPVEVHVSQLVADPLHRVHGQLQGVEDDDVVGGRHGSLTNMLNKIQIKTKKKCWNK